MDDFDDLDDFDNISVDEKPVSTPSDKPSYDTSKWNKNKGNSGGFVKKTAPKRNIIGTTTIDVWNDDKIVAKELEPEKFKVDSKYVTIAMPSASFKISDEALKKIKVILELLHKKEYKVRFICNYNRPVYSLLKEVFTMDNLEHVTPWPTFCKDAKEDLPQYLVSDINLEAAAHYVKNFDSKHKGHKLIYGAILTTLFGQENDTPSTYFITLDPYKTDKTGRQKIDFTKSKDTANYYLLAKALNLDIFNLAIDSDYADLEQILL